MELLQAIMAWWRPIAFAFAAVAGIAAGITGWDIIRPWVSVDEGVAFAVQAREMHNAQEVKLQQLAGRSCETEIKLLLAERRDIQRQLAAAQENGNASWAQTMREQLSDVNEDLAAAKRSCGLG